MTLNYSVINITSIDIFSAFDENIFPASCNFLTYTAGGAAGGPHHIDIIIFPNAVSYTLLLTDDAGNVFVDVKYPKLDSSSIISVRRTLLIGKRVTVTNQKRTAQQYRRLDIAISVSNQARSQEFAKERGLF